MSLISKLRNKLARAPAPEPGFSGTYPFLDVLELIVDRHLPGPEVQFLQIGASDGVTDDPISALIRERGWQGAMVEPNPVSFRKLQDNLENRDGLRLKQALVSNTPGRSEQVLYCVKEEFWAGSHWAEQVSSMDRDRVEGFLHYFKTTPEGAGLPEDFDEIIEEVRLPCVHVSDLLADLGLDRLDLLVVDTIGHELRILKAFPFERITPKVIMFEHYLLSTEDRIELLSHLRDQGYAFAKYAVDTIAVKTDQARNWSVAEW